MLLTGDNKPKAYFEVKSPAPVDKKLVDAQMQQQQQKEQVAPPVVKDPVSWSIHVR